MILRGNKEKKLKNKLKGGIKMKKEQLKRHMIESRMSKYSTIINGNLIIGTYSQLSILITESGKIGHKIIKL